MYNNTTNSILLKLHKYAGYHPDCNHWFKIVAFLFGLFLYGTPLFLAIKGILTYHESDLILMIECLQASFLFADSLCRHIILHLSTETIKDVLTTRTQIWKTRNLSQRHKYFLHVGKKAILFYLCAGIANFLIFAVQPFTVGKLPITTYVPEGYFWKLFVLYSFAGVGVFVTILVTDALFCSLCTCGIVQFGELKDRLQNLQMDKKCDERKSEVKLWEDMKEGVEHHYLLIRYCQLINKLYSGIFLLYFVFSTGATCMQIYISTYKELPLVNRVKNWLYCNEQLAQSILYCTLAELLSGAASSISSAVYNSKWYDIKITQYKKSLVIIMAKAQEDIVFTGLGLVGINFNTFVVILKTALSFYTYLNSVPKLQE